MRQSLATFLGILFGGFYGIFLPAPLLALYYSDYLTLVSSVLVFIFYIIPEQRYPISFRLWTGLGLGFVGIVLGVSLRHSPALFGTSLDACAMGTMLGYLCGYIANAFIKDE